MFGRPWQFVIICRTRILCNLCGMIERKDADGIRTLKLAHGKVSAIDIELGEAFIARDGGRA